MTRRKLIWTALLIAATCAAVVAGAFLRPYVIAKYWGQEANLRGAYLVRAPLFMADLRGADLRGANLRGANLQGALLDDAQLQGTDLRGTGLSSSTVLISFPLGEGGLPAYSPTGRNAISDVRRGANLTGTTYDAETKWPEGFDPEAAGAVLVD